MIRQTLNPMRFKVDLGTSVSPLLNELLRQFPTRDGEAYFNRLQGGESSAVFETEWKDQWTWNSSNLTDSKETQQITLGGRIRSRHDGITQSLQGNKTQATIYIPRWTRQVTKPAPLKQLGVRTEVEKTTHWVQRCHRDGELNTKPTKMMK